MALRVFHIVGSGIFKATIQRTHCCDSMEMFSKVTILLAASRYVNDISGKHRCFSMATMVTLHVHCLSC